ncbi:MAG: hypothetical protein MJK11_14700, partial [Pseudomonadales bacterium]|nr:hypothetical protein [Pseudomonadales bacterium]
EYLVRRRAGADIAMLTDRMYATYYGKAKPKNKMAQTVLTQTSNMQAPQAINTLNIYGKLNFDKLIANLDFLQSKISYLITLMIIYFITSNIFMLKVLPVFNAIGEATATKLTVFSNWFAYYYQYLNLTLLLLFLMMLVLNYYIQKILTFDAKFLNSWVFKIFPSSKLKQSTRRLFHYLQIPLGNDNDGEFEAIIQRNIHDELTILIEFESNNIKSKLKQISAIISNSAYVFLLACISMYLLSAYTPIFLLGTIV